MVPLLLRRWFLRITVHEGDVVVYHSIARILAINDNNGNSGLKLEDLAWCWIRLVGGDSDDTLNVWSISENAIFFHSHCWPDDTGCQKRANYYHSQSTQESLDILHTVNHHQHVALFYILTSCEIQFPHCHWRCGVSLSWFIHFFNSNIYTELPTTSSRWNSDGDRQVRITEGIATDTSTNFSQPQCPRIPSLASLLHEVVML